MSMKRSRRVSNTAKGSQSEGSFGFSSQSPPPTWNDLIEGKPESEFKPYAMSATFARNDLIQHPKFGKGVVTLVEGSKVEILFQDGAKKLGHARLIQGSGSPRTRRWPCVSPTNSTKRSVWPQPVLLCAVRRSARSGVRPEDLHRRRAWHRISSGFAAPMKVRKSR